MSFPAKANGLTATDIFGGDQGGYDDIIGQIIVPPNKQNSPTYEQIAASEFYGFNFSIGDTVQVNYHIFHSHKKDSGVYFHVHFLTDGTNINPVNFDFVFSQAKGHNQENFVLAGTTKQVVQVPHGSPYRHYVSEITEEQLAGAGILEPDAVIMCCIKRVTNGGTDNTDKVFVILADAHVKKDKIATAGRAPDFDVPTP